MKSTSINPEFGEIIDTFRSKKNDIFKIRKDDDIYILKKYDTEFFKNFKNEFNTLNECRNRGIKVPKILGHNREILLLEYLPGHDCKKLFLESKNKNTKKHILSGIAEWLSNFHSAFKFEKRKGDCILTNFIYSDDEVYGIDFEESIEGDYLRDIGDLGTSILRLKPSFTEERFSMVDHFITQYFSYTSREKVDLTEKIVESLEHYSKYSSHGKVMKEWAEMILRNGLSNIQEYRIRKQRE